MAAHDNRQPPPEVAIVMVPLPAQGHLNQLLHLSRLMVAYNIPVHYVTTTTHLRQAKLRLHGWDATDTTNLYFHEFPIPKFESPNPDPNAINKFPSHLQPLFQAASHLRPPLAALLHGLSQTSHRLIIIHDVMMSSVVQDVAFIPNAESYTFQSISAFSTFWYFYDSLGKPFSMDKNLETEVPSLEDCFTSEFMDFVESELKYVEFNSGTLFNTCRVIEGPFLDSIEKLFENDNKKSWALGPFNPIDPIGENRNPNGMKHDCLKWLDEQKPKSVIYISFGSTVSLPDEQVKELALGLEDSGSKFIWVLRDADRGDFCENNSAQHAVPLGFEERVKGRGIVVLDWAPQLEILRHVAIGGFLSHCGWNSCMESISAGIPFATWPMHSDQPRNAMLMTQVLKIGFVVKDWTKRHTIVEAATVSTVVRKLMVSEEGVEVRRRAEELRRAVRAAVSKGGGVTRREMDSFIDHIRR